jgi:oxaloacetate decarboxylase alpha subunit
METIFRDASQSKIATRMKLEDMIPVAGKLDKVGYHIITEEIQELLKGK